MKIFLIVVTILFLFVLPVAFLIWLRKSRATNKLYWIGIVSSAGAYILFLFFAAPHGWYGRHWSWLFLAAFAIVTIISWSRLRSLPWLPPKKVKSWIGIFVLALLTLWNAIGIPSALSAREYPSGSAIHLSFPLQGGEFLVGHGGSTESMNHHVSVRAQQYALDILKLNSWGTRAKGLLPSDLSQYEIYGAEVVAPCSGEVIASESGFPDLIPPQGDPKNLVGNYVVIFAGNASILLAHLKPGSLRVKTGDLVQEGDVIAQVGNSGNTSEPHLHIHAVSGRHTSLDQLAGFAEGIPMLFDGQFLIRNDRVNKSK